MLNLHRPCPLATEIADATEPGRVRKSRPLPFAGMTPERETGARTRPRRCSPQWVMQRFRSRRAQRGQIIALNDPGRRQVRGEGAATTQL